MDRYTTCRKITTACLLAALAPAAFSQEAEVETEATCPFMDSISVEATLDYVSQYFFRGYEQLDSDQGLVFQPGVSISFDLTEDVSATLGTWGSIHTDLPSGNTNPGNWFEQDYYGSIDFSLGDFTASAGLIHYTFPAGPSGEISEVTFGLSYDDSDLLGDLAINPYIFYALEIKDSVTNTAFDSEDTYLEIGGALSFDMAEHYDIPIVWSVPIAVGLSPSGYYPDGSATGGDNIWGFTSVGLFGEVPLSAILNYDKWMAAWDLRFGVTLYLLNADVPMTDDTADSADNYQFVATVGISREW